MLPLGCVLGEGADLSHIAGVTYNPHHPLQRFTHRIKAWVANPKLHPVLSPLPEDQRIPAGTNAAVFLWDSQAAISRSLTGFHSKTAFGCSAYRLKHLESIYPSAEPCAIIMVPVQ